MRDDQLLQNLEAAVKPPGETYEWMPEHGITTYSQLFAFIKDETADTVLRATACWTLSRLNKAVDKRRAVPPLLIAFQSQDEELRSSAAHALGMLHSRRAVTPLINLLRDTSQSPTVRHWAVDALEAIRDERAIPLFRQIIDDPDENTLLRGRAIEEMFEQPAPVDKFIELLSDPISDIRFWAAYRLSQTYGDITTALEELDRIVGFDHSVPRYGLWHVDREALLPLETIYYQQALSLAGHKDEGDPFPRPLMYLVSPAPEYTTFEWQFLDRKSDGTYEPLPPPPVMLTIDSDWLANQLRESWSDIQLNVRQPRPEAYLLDWQLGAKDRLLIGGLHRDRYSIVLTGNHDLATAFMAWLRNIIPPEHKLFCYEWAFVHVELQIHMTSQQISEALYSRNQSDVSKIDELANGFPG